MPTPTNTPFVTPQVVPAPPVVPKPSQATIAPVKVYGVTCIEVDSIEKAVSVLEESIDPDDPKKTKMLPHACVRRVYSAKFEHDPKPLTQPAVTVLVESLEPLPFEPRKSYALSFQPV